MLCHKLNACHKYRAINKKVIFTNEILTRNKPLWNKTAKPSISHKWAINSSDNVHYLKQCTVTSESHNANIIVAHHLVYQHQSKPLQNTTASPSPFAILYANYVYKKLNLKLPEFMYFMQVEWTLHLHTNP